MKVATGILKIRKRKAEVMSAKNFQTERKTKPNKQKHETRNSASSDSVSTLITENKSINNKDMRLSIPFQTAETRQKFFSSKDVGYEPQQTSLGKLQLLLDIFNWMW